MFFSSKPSTTIHRKEMVLPVLKLGTLAFRSICKPFANKLKNQAGLHPKFRQFIIGLAQVAGAAIIFEVHRKWQAEYADTAKAA